MRILLVEDHPVNQKLAKLMLIKAGCQVEVANNGREAVEKYTTSSTDFDLIFMDVQMPEMDGIEATKAIREIEQRSQKSEIKSRKSETNNRNTKKMVDYQQQQPSINRVPIIALTAQAMREDRKKCLEGGMDDYITKPIKKKIVLDIMEKWIV